jgi:hypothetical protein
MPAIRAYILRLITADRLAWDHIGTMLSRRDIVQWIDEEIDRLQRARALLTGHTAPLKRGIPHTKHAVAAPSAATRKLQAERKEGLLAEYDEMDKAEGITSGVGVESMSSATGTKDKQRPLRILFTITSKSAHQILISLERGILLPISSTTDIRFKMKALIGQYQRSPERTFVTLIPLHPSF